MPAMNSDDLLKGVSAYWDREILPTLTEFIRIPNESPSFDRDWERNGHMARAIELVAEWVRAQALPGARLEVVKEGTRTPLLLVEVPGALEETVLIYGHIDKQPPMTGWREGLGPWLPVQDAEGRLYGRGGADDGYSVFAAVATLKALEAAGQPHGRIVILIECCEESGSPDLPHYLAACAERIGKPSLVICLDSGCGDYARLWGTTSLRGLLTVSLKVEVLSEGVHSGIAGGIAPSPIRIMRQLLDRIEDSATGRTRIPELEVEIPPARVEQARQTARILGGAIVADLPFLAGVHPEEDDYVELLLNSTWRSAVAVTGQEGIPELEKGGNVLLPSYALKIALRIPPTLPHTTAGQAIRRLLEADPPHGAKITVSAGGMPGWEAPPFAPWLRRAAEESSRAVFGEEACFFGLGGTIPFMSMIGERFPQSQFFITGVLGPKSNAHGPNEFLHVPYAKRLTACLAHLVAAHHAECSR